MNSNIGSKYRPSLPGMSTTAERLRIKQPWEVQWQMCHCKCIQASLVLAKHDRPTQSKKWEALYAEALPLALDQHACDATILRPFPVVLNGPYSPADKAELERCAQNRERFHLGCPTQVFPNILV